MKILHSADLHLDTPFTGRSREQAQFLKEQLLNVPEKLAKLCRQEQCDLLLLAGDVFDGPWSKKSFITLRNALEECNVPVFISPGNHDYVNLQSPFTTELWPSNVHIFSQPKMESVLLEDLDCRIYGAGYRTMDCGSLLSGFCAEKDARYRIGILHGDPTQSDSPCCPVTASQIANSNLDYLALGHIHKSGQLRHGKTLCAWPGCPMGRGFDETGSKGVLLVELGQKSQAHFHALNTPRFFDEKTSDPAQLLPAVGTQDFYRITLVGHILSPSLEELQAQYRNFPHLEFRDLRRAPVELWSTADKDSLEGAYFRILKDALEHSDSETAQIIELAAQLSRQILDGQEVVLP
jgi:DNA repair exonuclease SbcCD nuclease subunit